MNPVDIAHTIHQPLRIHYFHPCLHGIEECHIVIKIPSTVDLLCAFKLFRHTCIHSHDIMIDHIFPSSSFTGVSFSQTPNKSSGLPWLKVQLQNRYKVGLLIIQLSHWFWWKFQIPCYPVQLWIAKSVVIPSSSSPISSLTISTSNPSWRGSDTILLPPISVRITLPRSPTKLNLYRGVRTLEHQLSPSLQMQMSWQLQWAFITADSLHLSYRLI